MSVDIEQVSPLTYLHSLGHSALTPAEEGTRRLFQQWTRKVAYLKVAGFGVSGEAGTLDCLGGRLTWREGRPLFSLWTT